MPATVTIICPNCQAMLKGPPGIEGKKVRCKGCNNSFIVKAGGKTGPPSPSAQPRTPVASGKKAPSAPAPSGMPQAKKVPSTPAPSGAPAAKKPAAPPEKKPSAAPGLMPPLQQSIFNFASEEQARAAMEAERAKTPEASDIRMIPGAVKADSNPYGMEEISLAPRCPHCAQELPDPDAVVCLACGYHMHTRTHLPLKRTFDITQQDIMQWRMPGFLCAAVALLCIGFIIFVWVVLPALADNERNKDEWWTIFAGLWFQIWGSIIAAGIAFFTGRFALGRLIFNSMPPEEERI
jgi:hypothetical protein